jgi:hypothetical protein
VSGLLFRFKFSLVSTITGCSPVYADGTSALQFAIKPPGDAVTWRDAAVRRIAAKAAEAGKPDGVEVVERVL